MKRNYLFLIVAGLIMAMSSCSDDTVTPTPLPDNNNEQNEVELSIMEKISQEWVLKETFRNGQQETSDGTTRYLFTEEGAFFTELRSGSWEPIGSWNFATSDSSSIDVIFLGSESPTNMELKALTESELKTEFVVNGNTLNYNYVR